jgi:hypothetical protein
MWVNHSTGNYNGYNENIRLFPAGNNVSVIAFGATGDSGEPWQSMLGYSDRLETRYRGTWEQRQYSGYVEARGSSRAPIFYDSNDTNYRLDPNTSGESLVIRGSIRMEQGNSTAKGIELNSVKDSTWPFEFTTNDVGNDNPSGFWVGSNGYPDMRLRRENGTVRALISSWEQSYVSNGFRVDGTTDLNGDLFVGTGTSSNIYMEDSDHGRRRIHCNSNRIGFLNEANAWGSYCGDGGDWYSDQSIRTPIFYDSNNTSYYIHGDSESRLNTLRTYALRRWNHHSGHLEGSYNNVGENSYKSNPIYTIGSSYNPSDAALGNMYGIGFSHSNASFISGSGFSGWGMYVAADGDARVYLSGSDGHVAGTGNTYFETYYDRNNTGYYCDPAGGSNFSTLTCQGNALYIRGSSPTLYFRDTNNRSAMIHNNSNLLYILRGSGNDSTSWTSTGAGWPLTVNLENNDATFGGNVTAYSDARLKENVQPLGITLDQFKAVKPKRFDWIESGKHDIGFIAQDVEAAGLVEVVKDFEQRNPETGELNETYKTLDYSRMVAMLWDVVGQQQTQIEELASQLKSLKENLNDN